MNERDPQTWTLGTWLLALAFPVAGGFVNWYRKMKSGHTRVFNIVELMGEIFMSGFVGLMVFMGMTALDYPVGLCAAASGIGGHMGTRLLFAVEKALENRIGQQQKAMSEGEQ